MTRWQLDHLVVGARALDEGIAWCEATLGFAPTAGGTHPLMGTHNKVFSIASARFARAYFEIIAIDAQAPAPGRTRWFDLDDAGMRRALADGPALIHWAARCSDLGAELAALRAQGIDRGEAIAAERYTPNGLLRWRISVRADGRRLADGALPTLIEWGDVHPTDAMPASGIGLEALSLTGLPDAVVARLPAGVATGAAGRGVPPLVATLSTPRGPVSLRSIRSEP